MVNKFENQFDFRYGDGRPTIRTKEGQSAIFEAIEFLNK